MMCATLDCQNCFIQTPRQNLGKGPHEQRPAAPPAFQSGLLAGQL